MSRYTEEAWSLGFDENFVASIRATEDGVRLATIHGGYPVHSTHNVSQERINSVRENFRNNVRLMASAEAMLGRLRLISATTSIRRARELAEEVITHVESSLIND